jgi:hypothetical protein
MVMIWMRELIKQKELPDKHTTEAKLKRLQEAKDLLRNISDRVNAIYNSMSLTYKEEKNGKW